MLWRPHPHTFPSAIAHGSPPSGAPSPAQKALGGGQDTGSPAPLWDQLRDEMTNEKGILSDSVSLCYSCPQCPPGSCRAGGAGPRVETPLDFYQADHLHLPTQHLSTHACIQFTDCKNTHSTTSPPHAQRTSYHSHSFLTDAFLTAEGLGTLCPCPSKCSAILHHCSRTRTSALTPGPRTPDLDAKALLAPMLIMCA